MVDEVSVMAVDGMKGVKNTPDWCVDARAGQAFEWEMDDEIEHLERRAAEEKNAFILSSKRGDCFRRGNSVKEL
jgi:hypothetical protein